MSKMFDFENIVRLDFKVDEVVCNSDGVPVCSTGKHSFAVLFNKTQISEEEVMSLVESDNHISDKRVVMMSIPMADKLKGIIPE